MIKIIHKPAFSALRIKLNQIRFYNSKDQKFLRFIDFDAQYLTQIPYIFKPLTPAITTCKQAIININSFIGLPWWLLLILSAAIIRIGIFPLILVQMKRMSKIGPIWPILVHIKEGWRSSELSFWKKLFSSIQIYRMVSKQEKFRFLSVFVYNLVYYPLLITMIYSIRNVLGDPLLASVQFLHLNSLVDIDQYYILPTLTIGTYYYNFERFITPENKHTLISKIRIACQYLLIIWYPFLCCWPSGIVLYMFSNALISVLQSNLMKSRWFMEKMNKKILHYNIMLATVQYDKGTANSIIEAIKTGEESIKEKGIKESVLLGETEQMIRKLNKERREESVENEEKKDAGKNRNI